MTHDEMIAVIQAHKEGKQIQSKYKDNEWTDIKYPTWSFHDHLYRVKPEPKPDITKLFYVEPYSIELALALGVQNLRLTFDGETGELKSAEVLK